MVKCLNWLNLLLGGSFQSVASTFGDQELLHIYFKIGWRPTEAHTDAHISWAFHPTVHTVGWSFKPVTFLIHLAGFSAPAMLTARAVIHRPWDVNSIMRPWPRPEHMPANVPEMDWEKMRCNNSAGRKGNAGQGVWFGPAQPPPPRPPLLWLAALASPIQPTSTRRGR